MLRVFSNQLRRLNKKVNKLVEKAEDEEETNQLEGLYNIGEFYFKNQKYKNALYAYKRYFQYADENSAFYHTVENKIKACKEKLNITDDSDIAPPLDIVNENNSSNNDINNEDYNNKDSEIGLKTDGTINLIVNITITQYLNEEIPTYVEE